MAVTMRCCALLCCILVIGCGKDAEAPQEYVLLPRHDKPHREYKEADAPYRWIMAATFSADGKWLLAACHDQVESLTLWDVPTRQVHRRFSGGNDSRVGSGWMFARVALKVWTRGDSG